jgi:hypothetical protein
MGNCPIYVNGDDEVANFSDVGQVQISINLIYYNILKKAMEMGKTKTSDKNTSHVPPS